MKLKLNTTSKSASSPQDAPEPSSAAPKLKLSFGGASTPSTENPPPAAGSSETPKKPKRQYNKKPKAADGDSATPQKKASKKRPRPESNDGGAATEKPPKGAKKKKTAATGDKVTSTSHPVLKIDTKQNKKLMINLKSAGIKSAHPTTTPRLKVKHQGVPPPRPHGVGYDSGAEDAEEDPAIEHQFILRMLPGEDCDYLRQAIQDKKIGIPKKEGGADVHMRFYDREGRRAMVSIRGTHYAACLVDLPSIVEGMKSWDRRGWWKSADICQMLLVFQRVKNDEEARAVHPPKEVDDKTWSYPHGLTPPMHWVRKRRFRKRVSFRTIEAVEKEVEQLLADDEAAREKGGSSEYTLVDLARMREESEEAHAAEEAAAQEAMDEDAEGEEIYDDNGVPIGEPSDYVEVEGEEDADLLEHEMERMLEAGDSSDDDETAVRTLEVGSSTAETLITANPVSGQSQTVGATPSSAAAGTEESSDDDEDDDDDVDEETRIKQQEKQQIREEIQELEVELQDQIKKLQEQKNPLLKTRAQGIVDSIKKNLDVKRNSLGENLDDN